MNWQKFSDEHTWRADVGEILRLYVSPVIRRGELTYVGIVYNSSLTDVARGPERQSVEEAKGDAAHLAIRVLNEGLAEVR